MQRRDLRPLAGLVLLGGVIAPVLLMAGLHRVSDVSGSLLLNLEGPLTALIRVVAFGEYLSRRAGAAVGLVFGGGAALTLAAGSLGQANAVGALLIGAACAAWAIDNNLTQVLTVRDPYAIVAVKTGVAATVNPAIGTGRNVAWPTSGRLLAIVIVGAVGYGVSVVADAYALRLLGAARESAVFATAPFAGGIIAFAAFGERLSTLDLIAGILMGVGLFALIDDQHAHEHRHKRLDHEHRHRHDEHHLHRHGTDDPDGEPHNHPHGHEPLSHAHGHVSDSHHRHQH